ncbi:MAG: phage holin family protein [Clostridia bacterium]|nr:phage holin family protein [Clostridia bacterium]
MAQMFGGWDAALGTLIAFMAVDYVTGFLAAAVFHKSRKTEDGTLESRAGWKGLCRKGVSLAAVLVACRLDLLMGSDFIRDAVVIGFAANEALSILENAGLMGVPLPGVIASAVHVLRDSSERAAKKVEESDAGRKEGGE